MELPNIETHSIDTEKFYAQVSGLLAKLKERVVDEEFDLVGACGGQYDDAYDIGYEHGDNDARHDLALSIQAIANSCIDAN